MDTNLANLSIFSYNETPEFKQRNNILCLNDVSNSDVETEFNTGNVDGVMSLKNYFKQFLEPSNYTHSSTQEELKNESREGVESMTCADELSYTAAVSSLDSDNFMEKAVVEEYFDQEIIAANQNISQSFNTIEQTDKNFGRTEKKVIEEAYKCKHCELSFITIQKLNEHIKQHSNKQSDQKNILEESTCLISNSADELTDHVSEMKNYFISDHYLCKICDQYCESNAAMLKHLRNRHTIYKNCLECKISFEYRVGLTEHMNIHKQKIHKMKDTQKSLTKNLYPCVRCDEVFKSKSSITIHMRLHMGKQIFNCPNCDKVFAYSGSLRKHERIHTGENPYACPVCPETFKQKIMLHEHIQKLHCSLRRDEELCQFDFYKCPLCRSLFRYSSDYCTHLMKHSNENAAILSVIPSLPEQRNFLYKDGKCSRNYSSELNYCSSLNPTVIDSDNSDESEDLESVNKLDLAKSKTKPNNNNKSVFTAPEHKNLWNLNHINQVKYYWPNNYKFYIYKDVTLGSVIDDSLIEGEPIFSSDNVKERYGHGVEN